MTDVVVSRIPVADVNAAVAGNLDQLVHEIIVARGIHVECLLKQGHLPIPSALRQKDHQAGVDFKLGVFLEKVPSVVGHDDLVVGNREPHQVPILPARLSEVRDVVGLIARRFRDADQRPAQAFVDQESLGQ